MLGYTIWDGQLILPHLADGIRKHIPVETPIILFLDDSQKETEDQAYKVKETTLKDYNCEIIVSKIDVRELGSHNAILRKFCDSDSDFVAIYQDDQIISGNPFPCVQVLSDSVGYTNIGVIGGRDGYNPNFQKMYSSPWSASAAHFRLGIGEYKQVLGINSGPVIYGKESVRKAGYLYDGFHWFYVWDDYCCRCTEVGLKNFVMGTSVEVKVMRIRQSTCYLYPEQGKSDRVNLVTRNGKYGWSQ